MYPLNMTNGEGYAVANNETEHKALTAYGYNPPLAEEAPEDEKEALRAQLTAKGIEFDARWGVRKLREALEG